MLSYKLYKQILDIHSIKYFFMPYCYARQMIKHINTVYKSSKKKNYQTFHILS